MLEDDNQIEPRVSALDDDDAVEEMDMDDEADLKVLVNYPIHFVSHTHTTSYCIPCAHYILPPTTQGTSQ